ncbi:MAG: glycosyl transferase, partial [Bdellovibrionaceae bacterium]|nr:glycosyl transferase [Pseudobdellovibrionaceae bacterium]
MRVLILRLSSFGDILQTLPAIDALAAAGNSVSFLTKKNFSALVKNHPKIEDVLELQGNGSLIDLWATARLVHSKNFSHIYD